MVFSDKLLTPKQTAEILSWAPKTLYNLKSMKRLPFPLVCLPSGRWRIRQSDLLAFIDDNYLEPKREGVEFHGSEILTKKQQKIQEDWSQGLLFLESGREPFLSKVIDLIPIETWAEIEKYQTGRTL